MGQYKEFPRMIYGSNDPDHFMIIHCEEERPDGWLNHWLDFGDAAEKAKDDAKAAEKEYRAEIRAYLDEHNVDYAKNLSTPKLEELKVKLDDHLAQQES